MKILFILSLISVLTVLQSESCAVKSPAKSQKEISTSAKNFIDNDNQSFTFHDTPADFQQTEILGNSGWARIDDELWQSKDGGVSWMKNDFGQLDDLPRFGRVPVAITKIQILADGSVWVLADDLFFSKDEGVSWRKVELPGLIRSFDF